MGVKTICYLSFGYPSIEGSIEAAGYYVEGGADAIEVSLPPHNPYRDSAFIQGLYKVALEQTENYDDYLDGIAQQRAVELISNYSHVGCRTSGECIAKGQTTVYETFLGWYNSPSHYKIMTNPGNCYMGYGYAIDPYSYFLYACLTVNN